VNPELRSIFDYQPEKFKKGTEGAKLRDDYFRKTDEFTKLNNARLDAEQRQAGEAEGHPFRGSQYTEGSAETVELPVVCIRCKEKIGMKAGFPVHLTGTVTHGLCPTCLPAYRKEMLG